MSEQADPKIMPLTTGLARALRDQRWPKALVDERWDSFTTDEREAWLRCGWRKAAWESTPDCALRILKADPRVSLKGAATIDTIFRAAYDTLVKDGPNVS